MPSNSTSTSHAQSQSMLNDLVSRAHSHTTTQRILTDKVQKQPLLLQPTLHTDSRALRRHVRQRKKRYHIAKQARRGTKPLSAAEKRRKGIYNLKKGEIIFEVYKGLNELWNGYMLEILGFTRNGDWVQGREVSTSAASTGGVVGGGGGQGSILASADMHGAEVQVVRSRDVGRVGVRGVVVRETKFGFVIVGEGVNGGRGRSWCVPKRGSVFEVTVRMPEVEVVEGEAEGEAEGEQGGQRKQGRKVVFEIQGTLFEYRPVERANRKFKFRVFDDV